MKRTTFIFVLLFGIALSAPFMGWAEDKPKGNPPIITQSFAVEKAYYGYIWKIYLEAEDPDGDMSKVAIVVDQPGQGRYPTDWIILKEPYRGKFRGYLQWNTFSRKASFLSEWTTIEVRVSITDKKGNESNEVIFPFSFETGVKNPDRYKLPPPFDQGVLPKLGYIGVDLIEPTARGGDSIRTN